MNDMPDRERLREYLWKALQDRKWLVADLAEKAGLSHATLSNVLNARHGPSIRFYRRVAMALRCDITELLEAGGEMPPQPPEVKDEARLIRLFRKMAEEERRIVMIMAEALGREGQSD